MTPACGGGSGVNAAEESPGRAHGPLGEVIEFISKGRAAGTAAGHAAPGNQVGPIKPHPGDEAVSSRHRSRVFHTPPSGEGWGPPVSSHPSNFLPKMGPGENLESREGRRERQRKEGSKGELLVQVRPCSWGNPTSLRVPALGSPLPKLAA